MLDTFPKKIGFYTGGPPFDGGTLDKQALGGSETALVQAALALARRGHKVTVFNNCTNPGVFDGVEYLPVRQFVVRAAATVYDVFIVSRLFGFFSVPFQADLKVLWNHDTLDRPDALRAVLDRIDLAFVLSEFHKNNYLTRVPSLGERIFVTRNGLDINLIDRLTESATKDPNKIIYASRPERGLKVLLESIWPRLKHVHPDLRLYLCGYEVGRRDLDSKTLEMYDYLDDLIRQSEDVVPLGALPKEAYYRHLGESSMMLYPSTFPEISCIAALEAQACRTPILTTDGFALSETVQTSAFKIPGKPGTPGYDEAFVNRAAELLEDPVKAASLAEQARAAVEHRYTWAEIVGEWDRLFDLALASQRSRRLRESKTRAGLF